MVIWITGLAGAGKTTVANEVARELQARGQARVHLDGDAIREAIQDPHTGHDRESRLANAYRICRLARLLEQQGLWVVVSTMSLFSEIHSWNRQEFTQYVEVLLDTPLKDLRERDQKGLYSGNDRNVVGRDLPPELPREPDLVLSNGLGASPNKLAQEIISACNRSPS